MKYSELHRIIVQNGWTKLENRGKGSHVRYEKKGKSILYLFIRERRLHTGHQGKY